MTTRCRVCSHFHNGKYQICDNCLKTARADQNTDHHPDCPKAWHDSASCMCRIITLEHYA